MCRRICAFTLIELLIGVALLAVLITVGIPGFRDFILDNRMTAEINSLLVDLNYARSEAVKRNVQVTVCKRNAQGTACKDDGSWRDGWIVSTATGVLRVHDPLPAGSTIGYTGSPRIIFDGKGFLTGVNNGTFIFCDVRGYGKARGLAVARTGRVRATRDDNGDGIHEDGSGNNFTPENCR
ncbi:MAG TPA: GspH/FimT family pseudopilin [Methylococcus sp.]|nr:GspH/FimT family pseudopilin [Methylococcus sp.]